MTIKVETPAPADDELVSPDEACKEGKFSKPTLYKAIRDGRVKAYKFGQLTRIDRASLREAMRAEPLILAPKPPKTMSEETRAKLAAGRKKVTAAQPARRKPAKTSGRKAERERAAP